MTKEPKKTREPAEKNPLIEDAILRETVKQERRFHRDFGEFQPSIASLRDATPDKPLVSSFCSSKHEDEHTEEDEKMLKTLRMDTKTLDPKDKYPFPVTTSQEIGWDVYDYRPKSIFNFKHLNTDVTKSPTHYDPLAARDTTGSTKRGTK